MRLLNAITYELRTFIGSATPAYAILSHTWGDDEVTMQEIALLADGSHNDSKLKIQRIMAKRGFQKIRYTCEEALRGKLHWVWVDTCCIDKSSSAELSEAINSMFKWYCDANICYAYLRDVEWDADADHYVALWKSLRTSRWFTRGWTLQELIAPSRLSFYDTNWSKIGSRDDQPLLSFLQAITSIPRPLLDHSTAGPDGGRGLRCLPHFSVAHRMSWAASRECTREEDVAYCLLGIFGVNLPLLYGEGTRAFLRLQEEILRTIDDHSLLAWTAPPSSLIVGHEAIWGPHGAFANSPSYFYRSEGVKWLHEEMGEPSTLTKKGLRMSVEVVDETNCEEGMQQLFRQISPSISTALAVLNCGIFPAGVAIPQRNVIILLKPGEEHQDRGFADFHCYFRLCTPDHVTLDSGVPLKTLRSLARTRPLSSIYLRTHYNAPWDGLMRLPQWSTVYAAIQLRIEGASCSSGFTFTDSEYHREISGDSSKGKHSRSMLEQAKYMLRFKSCTVGPDPYLPNIPMASLNDISLVAVEIRVTSSSIGDLPKRRPNVVERGPMHATFDFQARVFSWTAVLDYGSGLYPGCLLLAELSVRTTFCTTFTQSRGTVHLTLSCFSQQASTLVYTDVARAAGELAEVSLRVGYEILTMTLHSNHPWSRQREHSSADPRTAELTITFSSSKTEPHADAQALVLRNPPVSGMLALRLKY